MTSLFALISTICARSFWIWVNSTIYSPFLKSSTGIRSTKIGCQHPAAPLCRNIFPGLPVDISGDAGCVERRELAEQRTADTGEDIAGPSDRHRRVTRTVEPHLLRVSDNIDVPLDEHRSREPGSFCNSCPADCIVREFCTGDPEKLPGVRGINRFLRGNRQWQMKCLCIEDRFLTMRCQRRYDIMALRSYPVSTDNHVSMLCEGNKPVDVFHPYPPPLQPLIDKIGDRLEDRGCYPHDIRTCPQGTEPGKVRGTLVRPPADDQHFSRRPLYGPSCSVPGGV